MTSRKRLYELAEMRGWKVIEELPDDFKESTPFYCEDKEGYKYRTSSNNLYNKKGAHIAHKTNKYSLDNIQHFLDLNDIPFELIEKVYLSNNSDMQFRCKRCGTIVKSKWCNINKYMADGSKGRLICRRCDGTVESLHAIALKQMFLHEYPDTVVEDRSFVNPFSNHVMPTDIVNHRLKIAIEVQSQWHDFEDRKWRDEIKKDYWISREYSFYDPDIRNYTILEMLKLFFEVDNIPEFIDFSQANKLNLTIVQKLLDNHISPRDISERLEVNIHRIYDAIGSGNLHYAEDYVSPDRCPVVCFDMNMNKISEFKSIADACRSMNVKASSIVTTLNDERNYSQGYYWQRLSDYQSQKPIIPTKLKRYK